MISIFCGMFVLCKEWYAMLAAVLVAEPFTPGLKPGASLMGYSGSQGLGNYFNNLIIFLYDDSCSVWHCPASQETSTVSVKKNLLFEPSVLCELAEGNH